MRRLAVLAIAAAALAGCSQQGEGEKAAPKAAESNAELLSPRPGLWEQAIASPGAPAGMTMRVCVGAPEADDAPFNPAPTEEQDCSAPIVRKVSGGVEFEVRCASGSGTMTSKGKLTGDLRSAYKADLTMTMSGPELPEGMPTESAMSITARRLGDCPAGVEPGSILP